MQTPIVTSELTSAIGFFLTLTSLLGTYFYVHLSTWFRDILELKGKWELNADGQEEFRKRAQVECRFQLRKLHNHIAILISFIITTFIIVLYSIVLDIVATLPSPPTIINYYNKAFMLFFVAYGTLTLYFLIHGYALTFILSKKMQPKT